MKLALAFLMSLFLIAPVLAEPMVTDQGVLKCPCPQPPAKNGDKPDVEVLKKLVRCHKGEKPVDPSDEGAVTVEIVSLQVGAPRPWDYNQDRHGEPGNTVYPVKVQYNVKTHYRTRTAAEMDWIRILNFYVNGFGEWAVTSEIPVKSADVKSIPR